jgi:hypothetical protein
MHRNPKWQELLNLHNGGCHPGLIFEEQAGEEQMYRAWVNEQRAPQWQTPRLSNLHLGLVEVAKEILMMMMMLLLVMASAMVR